MRAIRAQSVDVASLRAFVAPHLLTMGRLATRLTSPEDRDHVVHAAVVAAAREPATYDARSGSARAWLLAIVIDRALRYQRRMRGVPSELVDLPSDALELDRWDHLDTSLLSLPWEQRVLMNLHYFLGLDVAECAAVIRCDTETAVARLAAARRRLVDGVEEIELS